MEMQVGTRPIAPFTCSASCAKVGQNLRHLIICVKNIRQVSCPNSIASRPDQSCDNPAAMEPSLRRAAQSLCGQCSTALRGRLAQRGAARQLAAMSSLSKTAATTSSNKQAVKATTAATPAAREYSSQPASSFSFSKSDKPPVPTSVKISQDDLFHSFTDSPVPEFRRRAAFMRQHACCPHPDHQPTKMSTLPEAEQPATGDMPPAKVDFECPDCGVPVYCSKEHWMDHYEEHLKVCDTLRQINEDDHDLRSGRVFHEANLPDLQLDDAAVNMTNWDTFMYSREFNAVDSDRSMRQITRLLTYPITVGSVLHELSPYNLQGGGRLTTEGLKSFSGK